MRLGLRDFHQFGSNVGRELRGYKLSEMKHRQKVPSRHIITINLSMSINLTTIPLKRYDMTSTILFVQELDVSP